MLQRRWDPERRGRLVVESLVWALEVVLALEAASTTMAD
jgi:hypothetical protein